jgi:hypothetical protein
MLRLRKVCIVLIGIMDDDNIVLGVNYRISSWENFPLLSSILPYSGIFCKAGTVRSSNTHNTVSIIALLYLHVLYLIQLKGKHYVV